jgi:hypothetical protein
VKENNYIELESISQTSRLWYLQMWEKKLEARTSNPSGDIESTQNHLGFQNVYVLQCEKTIGILNSEH